VVKKIVLKEDKILEKWSLLIRGAEGRGREIIDYTKSYIEESEAPGVTVEMAKVFPKSAPTFLDSKYFKNIEKEGRNYIAITNSNITGMMLLVGVQDYGTHLNVSWYLICEPRTVDKALALFSGKASDEEAKWTPIITNIFMEEELTAYTTLIHHSVLDAVENLMSDLGQDASKIDRRSKGFLGIS